MIHPSTQKNQTAKNPPQNNLKNTNPTPIAEAMPTVTPVAQAQDV